MLKPFLYRFHLLNVLNRRYNIINIFLQTAAFTLPLAGICRVLSRRELQKCRYGIRTVVDKDLGRGEKGGFTEKLDLFLLSNTSVSRLLILQYVLMITFITEGYLICMSISRGSNTLAAVLFLPCCYSYHLVRHSTASIVSFLRMKYSIRSGTYESWHCRVIKSHGLDLRKGDYYDRGCIFASASICLDNGITLTGVELDFRDFAILQKEPESDFRLFLVGSRFILCNVSRLMSR